MILNRFKYILILVPGIMVLTLLGCKKQTGAQVVVYSNDFESGDLSNITNGATELFNGTKVLGRFNTSFFKLTLNDLVVHNSVKVSFDLYIHDTWDGNRSFGDMEFGPDFWSMEADSNVYINTTFSNDACPVGYNCPPQSFPLTYPATNNPRTGSVNSNLPGACLLKTSPTGSTLYHIEKTFEHTSSSLVLKCIDHLHERDTTDPKCAESWSIDNLKITLVQ